MFKKLKHVKSLIIIILTLLVLCSACGLVGAAPGDSPPSNNILNTPSTDQTVVDPPADDIPTDNAPSDNPSNTPVTPAVPIVLMPVASGTDVESNDRVTIDYSNIADGYVMVKWTGQTTNQLRVQVIAPNEVSYAYRIEADNMFNVFPLPHGNGSYSVAALEQTADGRYAVVASVTFNVTMSSEFAPFLRPSQLIDFNESSNVVRIAADLATGRNNFLDKIAAVYDYVTSNISYDTDFAEGVISGDITSHIPDLDQVVARGRGICFDYAAVMTAMLRSQGIPTQMVHGFVGEVYHAWINVHSDETGWIHNVIHFDGRNWILMDPTFASAAGAAALADFIGDGTNYTNKHVF